MLNFQPKLIFMRNTTEYGPGEKMQSCVQQKWSMYNLLVSSIQSKHDVLFLLRLIAHVFFCIFCFSFFLCCTSPISCVFHLAAQLIAGKNLNLSSLSAKSNVTISKVSTICTIAQSYLNACRLHCAQLQWRSNATWAHLAESEKPDLNTMWHRGSGTLISFS